MTHCQHCAPELFRDRPLPVQRPPVPADEFQERPTIRDRRQIDLEDAIGRQKRPPAPKKDA